MLKAFVRASLISLFMVTVSVSAEADDNDRNGFGFYVGVMNGVSVSAPAIMFEYSHHTNIGKFTIQRMELFGANDTSLLYGFSGIRKSIYTSISVGINFLDDSSDVYDATGLAYELEASLLPGRKKKFGIGIKLKGSVNSIESFSGIMFGVRYQF